MRIAIRASGEVGRRATLILLSEPGLDELGVIGEGTVTARSHRIRDAGDLGDYDVIVTDGADPGPDDAIDAGVPLVTWEELPRTDLPSESPTILSGASLSQAIAPSLASHEVAQTSEVLELLVAWTFPGTRLRRGEAVPFPDPVGPLWATEVDNSPISGIPARRLAAPISGDWAGASARVTGVIDDGVVQRVVGVADHASHLEGIALAAAAVCVANASYPPGHQTAEMAAESFLAKALEIGLEVASYATEERRTRRR